MGRDWPAVRESVDLALEPFADDPWEAQVSFVRDEGLPFAVLGYEGFLNRWAVSVNGALGYFIVEPADDFHSRHSEFIVPLLRKQWPHLIPKDWG